MKQLILQSVLPVLTLTGLGRSVSTHHAPVSGTTLTGRPRHLFVLVLLALRPADGLARRSRERLEDVGHVLALPAPQYVGVGRQGLVEEALPYGTSL